MLLLLLLVVVVLVVSWLLYLSPPRLKQGESGARVQVLYRYMHFLDDARTIQKKPKTTDFLVSFQL